MGFGRRRIKFIKMSAGGNDFVLLDNREKRLPRDCGLLAQKLCRRKFDIGADGMLILENSIKNNFRMKYFNADGSHAAMCGNGARSIAFFAHRVGAAPDDMTFDTDAGVYRAQIKDTGVKLFMREPHSIRMNMTVPFGKKKITVHSIDTGVPHAVVFVDRVKKVDVADEGRYIRFFRAFQPEGTNVNFVQKKDTHTLIVRTYERGVEDETLACGTGVTASAVIAGMQGLVESPVRCVTSGGEVLTVHFSENGKKLEQICLEGPVATPFEGEVNI